VNFGFLQKSTGEKMNCKKENIELKHTIRTLKDEIKELEEQLESAKCDQYGNIQKS